MILASSGIRHLGADEGTAVLRFGEAPTAEGTWAGRRLLWLDGKEAFELTFWCGTCPVLFQRLEGAARTLSVAELEDRLSQGLSGIDSDVVAAFAQPLPAAAYFPMLVRVTPRLVTPIAGVTTLRMSRSRPGALTASAGCRKIRARLTTGRSKRQWRPAPISTSSSSQLSRRRGTTASGYNGMRRH